MTTATIVQAKELLWLADLPQSPVMKARELMLLLVVLLRTQSIAARDPRSLRGMYPLNRFMKPAHK